MRSLAIALLAVIATPAFAGEECYQKTITVCPTKRKKPLPKPAPAPVFVDREVVVEKEVVKVEGILVPVPVEKVIYRDKLICPRCPPDRNSIGIFGELGLMAQDPYATGMLGIRLQFPKAFLGAQIFSQLQYGLGAQLLTYVYRGDRLKVHVGDPGVLFPLFGNYLTVRDVPRDWDLIVGAGAQYRLLCNLDLIADLRVDIPDPVKLANRDCVGKDGQRIDTWNALGNALAGTQAFVGLLFHN